MTNYRRSNTISPESTAHRSDMSSDAADLSRTFNYLLATQVVSRLITFGFNKWVARRISDEDNAVRIFQYPLFVTCVLSLSREGIRRACLRTDVKRDGNSAGEYAAKLLKVAWLTFPLGMLVTVFGCGFVLWWRGSYSDPYAQGILINGLACILELLAEPLYILSQNLLLLRVRLVLETLATFSCCLTTYFLVLDQARLERTVAFAQSQAAYGACLLVGYWGYFLLFRGFKVTDIIPYREGSLRYWDKHLLSMCRVFTLQSFGKLLLGQGEKLVLVCLGTLKNQAAYGDVDKLGSLVVRLVFLPFEESSYATFVRSASSGQYPQKSRKLASLLVDALKFVLLIGLVFIAFGPSYSYSLIRLLDGPVRSKGEATATLQYYCFYILPLAINGTSEAFVHAVAAENELKHSNLSFFGFSVINLILNLGVGYASKENIVLSSSAGAAGLIIANCTTMILRIYYSVRFIKGYFQDSSAFSFKRCLPSGSTILLFSFVVTQISEKIFLDHKNFWPTFFIHFSVGFACFCLSAFIIYQRERPFMTRILHFRDHLD